MRRLYAILLIIVIVIASAIAAIELLPSLDVYSNQNQPDDFFFGVSFCGNTTAQAKLLVDRVKNYTNLFVVQSGPVSTNETSLNEIVDYAVASGLDVIAYFGYFRENETWQVPWLDYAKQTWGDRFLGVYMHDEPGGVTVDANWTGYFQQLSIRNSSYYYEHQPAIDIAINDTLPLNSYQLDQTAYHFIETLRNDPDLAELKKRQIHAYTSDYALYWFDYQGGYDTVFAELGSNESTIQTIAQARGAANVQNKNWGTIITWTYDEPPYLVNATDMYSELLISYMAGAKYAVIFNYPQIGDNPYGVLTDAHFLAMERFWSDIQTLRFSGGAEAAFVLPPNYGWAMRSENDSVWGLWPSGNSSVQIWSNLQVLLSRYSLNLDIIYDDPKYPLDDKYPVVYWWNQTL